MRNLGILGDQSEQVLAGTVNCKSCASLQERVELAARELSRAIRDAMIAIAPISGMVAGNRIATAESNLRLASGSLKKHQSNCSDVTLSAGE
jgi:hypothetical protein